MQTGTAYALHMEHGIVAELGNLRMPNALSMHHFFYRNYIGK